MCANRDEANNIRTFIIKRCQVSWFPLWKLIHLSSIVRDRCGAFGERALQHHYYYRRDRSPNGPHYIRDPTCSTILTKPSKTTPNVFA